MFSQVFEPGSSSAYFSRTCAYEGSQPTRTQERERRPYWGPILRALPGFQWAEDRLGCSATPNEDPPYQASCSEPPPEARAAHRPRELVPEGAGSVQGSGAAERQRGYPGGGRALWDLGFGMVVNVVKYPRPTGNPEEPYFGKLRSAWAMLAPYRSVRYNRNAEMNSCPARVLGKEFARSQTAMFRSHLNTSRTVLISAALSACAGNGGQSTQQTDSTSLDSTSPSTASTGGGECGDGAVEGVEECDDSNANDHDACTNACKQARCGDDVLWTDELPNGQPPEECDDGVNNADFDGWCTKQCQLANCGDSIVQSGAEECDDGKNGNNYDDACTDLCKYPACGDGYLQAGEECDEGPDNADDGYCLSSCHKYSCGDGFVFKPVEQCDQGDPYGFNTGCVQCSLAFCGDGWQYEGVEECDHGDGMYGCISGDGECYQGFCLTQPDVKCNTDYPHPAVETCSKGCIALPPKGGNCGDGVVDPEEMCDDGDVDMEDDCTIYCEPPKCGDYYIQDGLGEKCDLGAHNGPCPSRCSGACQHNSC